MKNVKHAFAHRFNTDDKDETIISINNLLDCCLFYALKEG